MARRSRRSSRSARRPSLIRGPSGMFMTEYAVLGVVFVAALLVMMLYAKRTLMGRMRDSADSFGHGRLYEPSNE